MPIGTKNNIKSTKKNDKKVKITINESDEDSEENKALIKDLHKKLYQAKKKKYIENAVNYYEANKEELTRRIMCKCGLDYCKRNLSVHKKTKIHQAYEKGVKDTELKYKNTKVNDDTSSSDSDE